MLLKIFFKNMNQPFPVNPRPLTAAAFSSILIKCKGNDLVSEVRKMLDKVLRIAELYDFYGALLTDKQRRCLEMHYLGDDSLAEIAEEFQVSRQAVHDILRRGEQLLAEYEAKLGLVARHRLDLAAITQARASLEALPPESRNRPETVRALELLHQLTDR
jgi:predicted DNA-binding protein YlxM (UPF0122 family)